MKVSDVIEQLEYTHDKLVDAMKNDGSVNEIMTDFCYIDIFDTFTLPLDNLSSNNLIQHSIYSWICLKLRDVDSSLEGYRAICYWINKVSPTGEFWLYLKEEPSARLIDWAARILCSIRLDIQYDELATDYHRELAKDQDLALFSSNNWAQIYERTFRSAIYLNHAVKFDMRQSIALLLVKNDTKLLESLEDNPCTLSLWAIFNVIGPEKSLSIMLKTSSDKVEFCSLAATLPFDGTLSPVDSKLDDDSSILLSKAFLKLTTEPIKFNHWMKILSSFPVRYPHIQTSLGIALAEANSFDIVKIYFDIIFSSLNCASDDGNRICVTTCLKSFSVRASHELKSKSWAYAHLQWSNWKYGKNSPQFNLSDCTFSVFDYAVSEYFKELPPDKVQTVLDELVSNLCNIRDMWWVDHSEMVSEFYILKSQVQLMIESRENDVINHDYISKIEDYEFFI
ncbi:hypothetical protein [Vibrio europaeus]|uniref:DUF4034 domain-containing protein n=1 Tax=Vibrio europaeus TaxID=300876 RepID=A0A178J680_9VIBR|nr:hypothetical protein [Vibrio europaeus]MDC5705620.1 hypothetical protein [Vibrio europaeus]MDC5710899.1 hypothetical protein [Vibrio europaeus]MDC5715989.1 hypothetical protein [Vibrio europaeus]MDC5723962.1 hypothetical protein [Vibrio europaeus]MDC5729341.1 hypothetical protein [Vibrio europaeus]